jgi:PAS domain S-box-containing protein
MDNLFMLPLPVLLFNPGGQLVNCNDHGDALAAKLRHYQQHGISATSAVAGLIHGLAMECLEYQRPVGWSGWMERDGGAPYAEVTCLPADNGCAVCMVNQLPEAGVEQRPVDTDGPRLREMIEALGEGVLVFSTAPGLPIVFANPAAGRIFGVPAGELAGRELGGFIDTGAAAGLRLEQLRAGQPFTTELVISHADGTRRDLRATLSAGRGDARGGRQVYCLLSDVTERNLYYRELHEYQDQLRALAAKLAMTEEYERRRIATAVESEISSTLLKVNRELAQLEPQLEGNAARTLRHSRGLLDESLDRSRSLAYELSPPILTEEGFAAALEKLLLGLEERHGVTTHYRYDGQPLPLSNEVRVVLYQSLRELLSYTVRESRASEICLALSSDGASVNIELIDNGSGFNPGRAGLLSGNSAIGQFTIRERLTHLGGRARFFSTTGGSTRISLRAPLLASQEQAQAATEPEPAMTGRGSISVVIADRQAVTREGLKSLLDAEPGIEVVAEAASGHELIALATSHGADVAVMELDIGEPGGTELIDRLKDALPQLKLVALTAGNSREQVSSVLRSGVNGFLLKDCAREEIAQAVRAVGTSLTFVSPRVVDIVVDNCPDPAAEAGNGAEPEVELPEITPREREVLELVVDGLSTKQVAYRLGISVKTVETHRRRMMGKLGVDNIADLTRLALSCGVGRAGAR